jgi:hypothetical protein
MQRTLLCYTVCGLTIASEFELPELTGASGHAEPNLFLRLSHPRARWDSHTDWFITWKFPDGRLWLSCGKVEGGYLLSFPGLADFRVDANGREVLCHAGSDTPADTLRHLLLDQVLPLILNLRGREALHATSVLTPFGVCAFAGRAGAGKSTLAADFMRAGFPVLSDDCLGLVRCGEEILVTPSYPGVRIWDDTRRALFGDATEGPSVAHYTSKRRVLPDERSRALPVDPQPLTRVYSLIAQVTGEGTNAADSKIESLSFGASLMELIKFAFRLDITDRVMLQRQFRFFEHVAERVTVRRLRVHPGFSSLGAVRAAILADMACPQPGRE